jgi:phosphatidylglycerophosphate synthase
MDACCNSGDQRPAVEGGSPGVSCPALTAVVLAEVEGSSSPIAALTVLDRLVVCLSRAGASRIVLVADQQPNLARATAMGLSVERVDRFPTITGSVIVASGNVLVTPADLKRMISTRGRLVTHDEQRLPLGVVDGLTHDWLLRLDLAPKIDAQDFAALVTPDSAKRIEQAYWASLTSSSDGTVDRHFNRPVGRLLSKLLVRTPVTPNQVSLFATLVGLAAAGLFASGTPGTALAGALVLQFSAVLDCIDGDIARALFKQSALGKWLDIVGDQVVHIGVFLGIGVGLWRSKVNAPVLALGIVAGVGVVLSFLVILRALLKPNLRGHSRLQKLIDATTNRDFSVLLILFALFGQLEWFLWLAAVGSHVFWLVAAGLQFQEKRADSLRAGN